MVLWSQTPDVLPQTSFKGPWCKRGPSPTPNSRRHWMITVPPWQGRSFQAVPCSNTACMVSCALLPIACRKDESCFSFLTGMCKTMAAVLSTTSRPRPRPSVGVMFAQHDTSCVSLQGFQERERVGSSEPGSSLGRGVYFSRNLSPLAWLCSGASQAVQQLQQRLVCAVIHIAELP